MTILTGGGEIGALIPSDSNVIEVTTANRYDTNFARCATRIKSQSSYAQTRSFAATNDIWVHLEYRTDISATGTTGIVIQLHDAADTALFRLVWLSASGAFQMQYWNGSAWTNIGSAVTSNANDALQTIDLHVVGDSAVGTGTLYLAGTERATGTADLLNVDDFTYFRTYGWGNVSDSFISQVIVSTTSTIGMRLVTFYATGTGSTDQWTGTYANIDETAYADADVISSSAADQVELFSGTNVGSFTGYVIRAVLATARAKKDGTSPTNLQLSVRVASTNYFSSSQALGAGYGAHVGVWETNPNTAADWLTSEMAALQFGVKSIA